MENSNNNNLHSKNDKDSQNFELIYSPRTTYSNKLDEEEKLFNDLTLNFDPITIKIIKKHFKERLGSLNKIEFISILKNHLLSWHQDLEGRERKLIKLLGRLFSEIDLNDNGSMEWAEFTNYIIHNSNSLNGKNDTNSFKLRFYSTSRTNIDTRDLSENVSYSFYIEKFNLIGLVEDGKSIIHFYDANTLKKLKCEIDLREIQKDIDELEDRELDERAKQKKKQQEENIKKSKLGKKSGTKNNRNKIGVIGLLNQSGDDVTLIKKEETEMTSFDIRKLKFKDEKDKMKGNKMTDKRKNPITNFAYKKLMAICVSKYLYIILVFLPEYDILLVSASNKRISAWKYLNGEFKNANTIREQFNIDKNYFACSILSPYLTQYCMAWYIKY